MILAKRSLKLVSACLQVQQKTLTAVITVATYLVADPDTLEAASLEASSSPLLSEATNDWSIMSSLSDGIEVSRCAAET